MSNLTAFINQRFQLTRSVAVYATLYGAQLNSAVWRMQVRPYAGSPLVTLDFMTGGSPQDPALTATYSASAKTVIFRAPTRLVALIPSQSYAYDFGFVLAGADFERVDGGAIKFLPGTTLAGVTGSPPPPTGSDDTVLVEST